MGLRKLLVFIIGTVALGVSLPGRAQSLLPPVSGTRAAGRGGTDVAFAEDLTSLLTNPAGLTASDYHCLQLETSYSMPQVEFRTRYGSDRSEAQLVFSPQVAVLLTPWHEASRELQRKVAAMHRLAEAMKRRTHGLASPLGQMYRNEIARLQRQLESLRLWQPSRFRLALGLLTQTNHEVDLDIDTLLYQGSPPQPGSFFGHFLQSYPNGARQHLLLQRWSLSLASAYEFSDSLSLGAGLHFNVARFNLKGFFSQPPELLRGALFTGLLPPPRDTTGAALRFLGVSEMRGLMEIDNAIGLGVSGNLGLLYHPSAQWTIGASYSSPTFMSDLYGKGRLNLDNEINYANRFFFIGLPVGDLIREVLLPAAGVPLADSRATLAGDYRVLVEDFDFPMMASLGFRFEPDSRWRFGLDVHWINWAREFHELRLRFKRGTSNAVNTMGGSDEIDIDIPLRWHDQWIVSTGAELNVSRNLALRAGYRYEAPYIRSRNMQPIFPFTSEHHATLGASFYPWPEREWCLHLGYEHTFPSTDTAVDAHDFGDYADSEMRSSTHSLWLGSHFEF